MYCFRISFVLIFLRILETCLSSELIQNVNPEVNKLEFSRSEGYTIFNNHCVEVSVHFLTRLRHKRHIHQNDFHILQVRRPSQNSNFQIHLAKSNHLVSPHLKTLIRKGNYILKSNHHVSKLQRHCFYHGVLSGDIIGEVALSACGNVPGFSGVILTDSNMYSLDPLKRFNDPADLNSSFNEISHTLSIVDGSDPEATQHCASAQMNLIPPEVKVRNEEKEAQNVFPDANKDMQMKNPKLKNHLSFVENMSPRQYPVDDARNRTVELAIFADQSFIEYLFKKLNTTSLHEIQGYIHVLTHITSINFQHPSLEERVNFRIVHEEFWYENPIGFETHNGTLPNFLESFCNFAYNQNKPSGVKNWDHAMLLTASNLTNFHGNLSYGGVAYLSGSCTERSSCSIVKARNFYGASTMTHEIGHSLGMNHDGQDNNKKCSSTGYFMSGTSGSGRVSWSSCSSKNIRNFFAFLDGNNAKYAFKFGRKYRKDCLTTFTSNTKYYTAFSTSKLPGEEFPPAFQCAFANQGFPIVNNWDKKGFCKKLYCGNSKLGGLMWEIHAPLEGSDCGKGKWCLRGECVNKTRDNIH